MQIIQSKQGQAVVGVDYYQSKSLYKTCSIQL